jgi:hypothetical protein
MSHKCWPRDVKLIENPVICRVDRHAVNMSIQMSLYIFTDVIYAEASLFKECHIP